MQQLDIQKIKDNISDKHQEFIKDLGCHSDRVLAEHNLTMELTFTRINFICESFVELGIVDKIEIIKDTPARKIHLLKEGYDNYVSIATNGSRIVIGGASYLSSMTMGVEVPDVLLEGSNIEEFDWEDFANQLLCIVHSIIYERKEALETKVWGTDKTDKTDKK